MSIPESTFLKRRKFIYSKIPGGVMIIPSNVRSRSSRDLYYPYTPNKNLYYLTGHKEEQSALVIDARSSKPKSFLYLLPTNDHTTRWEGERLGLKRAAKLYSVDEVRSIEIFNTDLAKFLCGAKTLYWPIGENHKIDNALWDHIKCTTYPSSKVPTNFKDARSILSQMRWVKDKDEIKCIKKAIEITKSSLKEILHNSSNELTELSFAKKLESKMYEHGATGLAFSTIVARGKNSTCLHHHPSDTKIGSSNLLLDCGASFHEYNSDLSRSLFVGHKDKAEPFEEIRKIVDQALQTTIKKIKPGITLSKLHTIAARSITKDLRSLGLIRSNNKEAYKEFFMHGIGHSLGLDTHDITPCYRSYQEEKILDAKDIPLKAGSVITVEPGIYIDKPKLKMHRHFKGIGVRIEENVLVTKDAFKVLSK